MTEQDKLIDAIKMLLRIILSYRQGSMTQAEFFKWCDKLEEEIVLGVSKGKTLN